MTNSGLNNPNGAIVNYHLDMHMQGTQANINIFRGQCVLLVKLTAHFNAYHAFRVVG